MVVAEIETQTVAWDAFLKPSRRRMVEFFRLSEWPQIRRELAAKYGVLVADEDEPHWVAPGSAVLWQQDELRTRTADGPVFVKGDWHPVSPEEGIPCNSADALSQWLTRESPMRLRPPLKGVAETAQDIIEQHPVDVPAPPRMFVCKRHGPDQMYSYPSWKAYLRHCYRHMELPAEEPPDEVKRLIASSAYYCHACGKPFRDKEQAEMHMRIILRRPGQKFLHSSLEDMEVKHG